MHQVPLWVSSSQKFYQYPCMMMYNFSSHVLNTTEKSSLSKGRNFAILPKIINYADYRLPFELLYR